MRSAYLVLAAIVGLALALTIRVVLVAPSQAELEQLVSSSWRDTLKNDVSISASSSFALFPRPEFILNSANIKTDQGLAISADRIAFSLDILDLITGNYRVTSVAIENGQINIPEPFQPRDRANTESLFKAIVGYIDTLDVKVRRQQLGLISFHQMRLRFDLPDPLGLVLIHDGTLQFKENGALSLEANAEMNKIQFDAHVVMDAPDHESKRERLTRFDYRDDKMALSGKGMTATKPDVQFIGHVKFETNDLNGAMKRALDQNNPALATPATMKADARLSFSAMTFSAMDWSIGKAKLNGNMLLDMNRSTPRITGTFAANTIDLTDFADHAGLKRNALGQWNREQFPNEIIPDLDLDLRLSSDLVTIQDVTIKSIALSVLLHDKNLELSLASGDLFDGSISGKIDIVPLEPSGRQSVKATMDVSEIDLERTLLALIDSNRVTGLASGRLNLQSDGQSSAQLIENLVGTIDLDASRVSFNGLNLLNFLHRVEQRPLGAGIALKSGTTEFDTVQSSLVISNGVGALKNTNFTRLPDLQIKLNGKIDLAGQNFAITGHALGASANDSNQSINLPFVLKGPFDNPAFLPDFVNVSKQAGPVAP